MSAAAARLSIWSGRENWPQRLSHSPCGASTQERPEHGRDHTGADQQAADELGIPRPAGGVHTAATGKATNGNSLTVNAAAIAAQPSRWRSRRRAAMAAASSAVGQRSNRVGR